MQPTEIQTDGNTANFNQSALMTAFNELKHHAPFDDGRTNRALGYLLDGNWQVKATEYGATPDFCSCPDSRFRRQVCKHSIAMQIKTRHDEIMEAEGYREAA